MIYKLDGYVRSNQPNFLPHNPIFIITDLQPIILPLLGHFSRSHLVIYIHPALTVSLCPLFVWLTGGRPVSSDHDSDGSNHINI